MKKLLFVIAGPNGSGKSSIISGLYKLKLLLQSESCPYVCADILMRLISEKYKSLTQTELWEQSALLARSSRENLLVENKSFSYETVFSHESHIEFLKKAKEKGYFIVGYFITTKNPEINVERVKRRVSEGGHTVPLEKIAPRYFRCMKLAPSLMHLSDLFFLFDNSEENKTAINVLSKGSNNIVLSKSSIDYPYIVDIIEDFTMLCERQVPIKIGNPIIDLDKCKEEP